MSISQEWMTNCGYYTNEILHSNEKEQTIDTFNLHESYTHEAEWKKSDMKGHMLYDSF